VNYEYRPNSHADLRSAVNVQENCKASIFELGCQWKQWARHIKTFERRVSVADPFNDILILCINLLYSASMKGRPEAANLRTC
jgi:hypothetical protein